MSNILMGLLILGLIFALASFGVYSDGTSTVINARAARIAGALERQIVAAQSQREEDGALPASLAVSSVGALTISYAVVGGRGFACASVPVANTGLVDALDRVQSTRASWFISGGCGNPSTAITTDRVLSAEV